MAQFNPDFWEIPTGSRFIESVPADRALWFETEQDRTRRYAMQDFFDSVKPVVRGVIDSHLTSRQREVVRLYFLQGQTQEDIASTLNLSQSTVSRHLFGTVRNGKKVGGAVQKLRKVIERKQFAPVNDALSQLQTQFAQSA